MIEPAKSVPVITPEAPSGDDPTTVDAPRPGGSGGGGRGLGRAMLMVVLGFAGGVGGAAAFDAWGEGDSPQASDRSRGAVFQPTNDAATATDDDAPAATDSGDALSPREVYQKLSPSVVHINSRVVKTSTGFFGQQEEQESDGTGSGFLIDDDGHIVTNAHVVEGAEEITVALGPENATVTAKLVGTDPSSDIAVIKIDPDAKELDGVQLAVAEFGDSAKLQVGDPVIAIGNPFGLDRTLTTGVVSALQREIPSLTDFRISDVIQTDAAVNPGNSGGPLLNDQGQVIGVNSQIQTKSGGFDGIAFAVPSSRVKAVSKDLIADGEVQYAWLGVAGGEITPALVKAQDLPVDTGVLLGEVTKGSPAYEAGLRGGREVSSQGNDGAAVEGGDIILKFDGEELTSMRQLADIVDSKEPGDKVKVEYLRGGDRRTATVTLGERSMEVTADTDG